MSDESIIDEILELASSDDDAALEELNVSVANETLYDAAVAAFGAWDAALAAALRAAVRTSGRKSNTSSKPRDEEPVHRRVGAEARHPIYTTTAGGHFFRVAGDELEVTAEAEHLDTPPDAGPMRTFQHVGEPDGVFLFSTSGKYYGLDPRMIPEWMGESELRSMGQILPLEGGESITHVLPRRAGLDGRIIHVTRDGKGKATDSSEYGRTLDRSGREGFLLNDGDVPVAVLHGPEASFVFCASSQGQGIHFDAKSDMRSMGRRAVGVNVMKVAGGDDVIVSAFLSEGVEQLAVITRQGMAKRIWFEDFRPQGRGGSGMQVCRLDAGDQVVGVVPCDPSQDLAITTSSGRVHRMPANTWDLMGRPAKGNRAIELAAGEEVIGLSTLPCGSEG